MGNSEVDDLLTDLFYDTSNTASYGGVKRLYAEARKINHKITLKDVKLWLMKQETYGVHFPYRSTYERSRVISAGIDYLWEMDLMDMQKLSRYNSRARYVLLVIDVFSRFVWCRSLKNKQGSEVVNALKSIFLVSGRKPEYLRSDKGSEFTNRLVQAWLAKVKITHIVTLSEVKAAVAERAIKTIKSKLFKYMYHLQTWRYIDVLQNVTDTYNATVHSSIGVAPSTVDKKDERRLWWNMYVSVDKLKPQRKGYTNVLHVGTYVRISFHRGPFDREYRQKWSGEIFQVYQAFSRDGVLVYYLRDMVGEKLQGSFYREELLEVKNNPEALYKIEKILKRKRSPGGEKMYFVKWLNWDRRFNSWIREQDMVRLK